MLLKVEINRKGEECPFKNEKIAFELNRGECFWLKGPSGAGKTSIAGDLAKLAPLRGAEVKVDWGEPLAENEKPIGILFQQGVIVDSLNLRENIILSLKAANKDCSEEKVQHLLESVDLSENDGLKMPNHLSGGMLRRGALSLTFAQEKKVIILDEPFVGLDRQTSEEVIQVIQSLKEKGVSFLLITHQIEHSDQIVTPGKEFELEPTPPPEVSHLKKRVSRSNLWARTWIKIFDYLGISIPLIICAFFAAGFATSMLFAEMLKDTDMKTLMDQFQAEHTSLLFKLFGHEIEKIAARYLPGIREKIYALTMSRGFVIEMGPLLTGLLLAGRIGGSYSGEVGMMQATNQNKLLETLGQSPRAWTLWPSGIAAFIAAPILTGIGTYIALLSGGWVSTWEKYALFPSMSAYWKAVNHNTFNYSGFWNYPPVVNVYRSLGFMVIILLVAEVAGRIKRDLQPRDVPKSITWAVVFASLFIILSDWMFSQVYQSSGL
ncbi:MAG: Vitamin B12 import ATP-binding protein BtuD [Chlamydiae bacterium]|nr:Vitamin B12 import ATP-binding protein BtuD [Chlamydiota bacterium]